MWQLTMRLNQNQIDIIRQVVKEQLGNGAQVSLFGSRVDGDAKGGDIDLLVKVPQAVDAVAWLSAQLAGRISRRLDGQKVDVILLAPNVKRFPIHDVAEKAGIAL